MSVTKERLEQLIARSTDIVVATDRKGVVSYYNDGASQILGYRPEEILGHFVAKLYPSLDEARRVMAAMRGGAEGGKDTVAHFRTTFLSKTGEEIPVAISGTILYDERGREDGTIGFAKDLRQILRKDQLATLGEVAIGLSHEVNNPLAVILNQAELLERDVERLAGDKDCSVESERIDAIRREVARIAEIVERLGEMAAGDKYETTGYVGPARMVDLRARRSGPRQRDRRLAGARILIADDDLGIRRTLAELLTDEGCEVETAGDGAEALARLEQGPPFDVVLSDVVMPKMDGYELFTTVRRRFPSLPMLMMTAFHYDRDHVIKRSRMEGLEGVIFKKPVDRERLRAVLIDLLAARKPGKRPRGTAKD
jgi:PAS domain S-box-containing protein